MQNVMQALYLTRNARGLPASARRYSTITWGEKKVSWYCQNPQVAGDVQMNMSGSTYYYVGLGY